ncbi:MAG: hypothetical protein JWQ49_6442 [Edaphobacter sp.]|nr:hypothetical protein [Edaphobacter sp.]
MTNAAPQPSTLSTEDFSLAFHEIDLTQYHEAGPAVAFYMLGFPPKRITDALAAHDRRSTSFFRTRPGQLTTPLARERAQDYAVTVIAGIAAESKFAGVPIAELRQVPGREDYLTVHSILDQLMLCHGCEFGSEIRAARLLLLEARAVAIMNQAHVWYAVESVAEELLMSAGALGRRELVAAIERGMSDRHAA